MKLDLTIHTNPGALRSREDVADLLIHLAEQLRALPDHTHTKSALYDRQHVRVGQFEITPKGHQ